MHIKWMMCLWFFSLLRTNGFSFNVAPRAEDCFFENLGANIPVHVVYQCVQGGQMDIDVNVWAPDNSIVYQEPKKSEGTFSFSTVPPGYYKFCFSNRMSTLTYKTVQLVIDIGKKNEPQLLSEKDIDPVYTEIVQLYQTIQGIHEDQQSLKMSIQAHHNLNENTSSHVLHWSIFEALVLISMSIWQIYYLRLIFEKKGPV